MKESPKMTKEFTQEEVYSAKKDDEGKFIGLEAQNIKRAGDKERFCLSNLIQQFNTNENFKFTLLQSESDDFVGYDGLLFLYEGLTDKHIQTFIVEAKVISDKHSHYDVLMYEQKKHNSLKRAKAKLKKQFIDATILYINFTTEGTYLFFIDEIIQEGLMPKLTKKENRTITSSTDESTISKQQYLLPKSIGVKKKFTYTDEKYAQHLTIEICEKAEQLKKLTYHPITF